MKYFGSSSASSRAARTAPFDPSADGENTICAPNNRSRRFRSSVAFSGITQVNE